MISYLFYHKQGFHVARAETPPSERDLIWEKQKCIIDKSLGSALHYLWLV